MDMSNKDSSPRESIEKYRIEIHDLIHRYIDMVHKERMTTITAIIDLCDLVDKAIDHAESKGMERGVLEGKVWQ